MNVPGLTTVFHKFVSPTIKFHDFLGLENEILEFHMTYQVFNDLFEPCLYNLQCFSHPQ